MSPRGQANTEYVVILAAVAVVALAMVWLASGAKNPLGGDAAALEARGRAAWAASEPFAIIAFNATNAINATNAVNETKATNAILSLTLVNNDLETLTLTDVSLGGRSVYSTATQFRSGETKTVNATLPEPCGNASSQFSYGGVVLTFTKGALAGLKETGMMPLAGRCS